MADFMTYIIDVGAGIDLQRAGDALDLCGPRKGGRTCGAHDEFHLTFHDDGEVWIEFLATDEQHRQIMRIAAFLQDLLGEQGVDADMTNLILNAKTLRHSIPANKILHSDPDEGRAQLGPDVNINIARLLLHWMIPTHAGVNWKESVKGFGHSLGRIAYTAIADTITDDESAIAGLKTFLRSNRIGILNQLSPGPGEIMRFILDESLSASGIEDTGRRACYLESGIISGFFTKHYRQGIACEEERCWALGGEHCEFSIRLEEG